MKKISILFALFYFFLSCNVPSECLKGKGETVFTKRQVTGFYGIDVHGPIDIFIDSANSYAVEVSDYGNLVDHILTIKKDSVLKIKYDVCVNNSDAKVNIYMPKLHVIKLRGSSDISVQGVFQPSKSTLIMLEGSGDLSFEGFSSKNMKINLLGSGDIDLNITDTLKKLIINSTGSGNVTVRGKFVENLEFISTGSGDLDVSQLPAQNIKIVSNGSGDIKVYATGRINASVLGSGNLYYKGNPKSININHLGSGSIEKITK